MAARGETSRHSVDIITFAQEGVKVEDAAPRLEGLVPIRVFAGNL